MGYLCMYSRHSNCRCYWWRNTFFITRLFSTLNYPIQYSQALDNLGGFFISTKYYGVVQNDRKTCFLLILLQQFYIWWLDYFFILTKCDGEIGTISLSNIRYSPLTKDFMLNLISYVKFSHYFFLLIYANITRIANIMIIIMCAGKPNMMKFNNNNKILSQNIQIWLMGTRHLNNPTLIMM